MGCGCSTGKVAPDAGTLTKKGGKGRPTVVELRTRHLPADEGDANKEVCAEGNRFLRSGQSLKQIIDKNAVLVVARVRPLNKRELEAASPECIEPLGNASIKVQAGKNVPARDFTYDAIFRSDASQEDVYARSGRMVLGKVLEGYNGCMLAYGQTGSGKTFTMMGTKEARGLIPLLLDELFQRIAALPGKKYSMDVSMCEIYNEKLNDLLVSGGDAARDLAIRDDAGGAGVYVDGLSSFSVDSAEGVGALIEAGQRRRAIGRTNMNEHSSRSHSVVTLKLASQDADDADGFSRVERKLHLVDLAGSERQKATGATGERLKEGAQINLSLHSLGNVTNALTDAKRKGQHVPYRDSKLTRLLSDSLGGNSVTVMLCNVSPAEVNAEETLSSLRFAERAKRLENSATIARDPKAERAAALFEENKALRRRVAQLEAYVEELERWY